MYKYETHLHTLPVSKCAKADTRASLAFYKEKGYDGVFLTNHFIDGNINFTPQYVGFGLSGPVDEETYRNMVNFYFDGYDEALAIGKEIGIKVFLGLEISYKRTDFLIFGLGREWFLSHPEILDMDKPSELNFMRSEGALVIQAHPFRRPAPELNGYIRVFVNHIDGIEVLNAANTDFENEMARRYAEGYGLLMTAGTDNHRAENAPRLAWVGSQTPINSVEEFISLVREGKLELLSE